MDFMRKLSFLVFLLCMLISLKKENAETKKGSPTITLTSSDSASIPAAPSISRPSILSKKLDEVGNQGLLDSPRYDFYRETCPHAEATIRSRVRHLHEIRSDVPPALLRLVFHDCFIEVKFLAPSPLYNDIDLVCCCAHHLIEGCDASVLLDSTQGVVSEKESPPNETLKGFDLINTIKSELEEICPGIVSCSDILVLAARESVILAGGPFYPLQTGRRDSALSFPEVATFELPRPEDDLPKTIALFASRGFDEKETVSLLGAHSIGTFHCKFILNRLYNFDGTHNPDPTIDIQFLNLLRSRCNNSHASSLPPSSSPSLSPSSVDDSLSSSTKEPRMVMGNERQGSGFGTLYYRSLLQARGILYVDQQLTAGEETETWVKAYAADVSLFRRDFSLAMMKLSNLGVLTSPMGQVRINCSKVG
ncbi:peroxidase [Sarracenia purpurea var. burkii]